MRLWQQPARQLPVRVRPMRGETLYSYTGRLSEANELKHRSTLLRALGQPAKSLHHGQFTNFEAHLNERALERLEIFTGTSREQLRKSLTALNFKNSGDLPDDIPATRPYRAWGIRTACRDCIRRIPGRPDIRVHALVFPLLCERHLRWTHTSDDQPDQYDLSATPEIITAHRKYARLRAANKDRQWTYTQLLAGTRVTRSWARSSYRNRRMRERWKERAGRLDKYCFLHEPPQALVLPEAITLAQIFSDLDRRREVALAIPQHLIGFYRHVVQRLGEDPIFASYVYLAKPSQDPLRGWVAQHRNEYKQHHTEYWAQYRLDDPKTHTYPENRHFK